MLSRLSRFSNLGRFSKLCRLSSFSRPSSRLSRPGRLSLFNGFSPAQPSLAQPSPAQLQYSTVL